MQTLQLPDTLKILVLGLLLSVSLPAMASEPRIAVSRSPLSLPLFVAKEKKLFEKHKVTPVFVECLGGNKCMKELVEGRVDMATASELPFMFAAAQGKPISLLTTFVTNKDDMKFVVRKSAVEGGVQSLVGKRVGFVPKASSHYFMDLFLLYQGIDPKSTIPVPMGSEALADALNKREVDAISVWEPWGQKALDLGGDEVKIIEIPRLYSQTFNLMTANQYKKIDPKQTLGVLSALEEAIQFIKKNPEEAKRIMARDAVMDQEMVESSWRTHQFDLSLQQSLLTTLQGQARWAKREGHLDAALPEPEFLDFIDSSVLRKLKPSAVDFIYP